MIEQQCFYGTSDPIKELILANILLQYEKIPRFHDNHFKHLSHHTRPTS